MAVSTRFQAQLLNEPPPTSVTGNGEEEIERRRQALQLALSNCLSAEEMAHTVRLCEEEFARQTSFSVSEFCQRLFETMPQIQLDKEARLRLLRAMRQPTKTLSADAKMPTSTFPEPGPEPSVAPAMLEDSTDSEVILDADPPLDMSLPADTIPLTSSPLADELPVMPSPEDSTSPEVLLHPEAPPTMPSPEDSASPELFVLRYTNFGKEIIG